MSQAGVASAGGGGGGGGSSVIFHAYLGSDQLATTGDGTIVLVQCDTAPINKGSGFNTGTFLFTPPSNGTYMFQANVGTDGWVVANTQFFVALVNSGIWQMWNMAPETITNANTLTVSCSFTTELTTGDPVGLYVGVFGNGAKNINIRGFGGQNTQISGWKLE